MPQIRKMCDVYQGYNFKKDKQNTVGFITKLTIGDKELPADQTCKNPTRPTEDLKVVAVCSDVLWDTGVTDATYFTGQVSTANRQEIAMLALNDRGKVDVTFQFQVYEYDPLEKMYYLCFHCDAKDLDGLLEKNGDDLNLSVDDAPSTQVQSPTNHTFNMGIKPQTRAQNLHVAASVKGKIVKAWGLAVG
jgi:hypothetical protein